MRARDPSRPVRGVLPQPEERDVLVEELHHPQTAGQDVKYDLLTGYETRTAEPALSPAVGSAVRLHDQLATRA